MIAACSGEYIADFGKGISNCGPAKELLGKISTLLLIIGLIVALSGFISNLQISEQNRLLQEFRIAQISLTNAQTLLQVATLQKENLELRKYIVEIATTTVPRVWATTNQGPAIGKLSGFTGISVAIVCGSDGEASDIAEQISFVVTQASWKLLKDFDAPKLHEGIVISVNFNGNGFGPPNTNGYPAARVLADEIQKNGIATRIDDLPGFSYNLVVVRVGHKPNPLLELQQGYPFFRANVPLRWREW